MYGIYDNGTPTRKSNTLTARGIIGKLFTGLGNVPSQQQVCWKITLSDYLQHGRNIPNPSNHEFVILNRTTSGLNGWAPTCADILIVKGGKAVSYFGGDAHLWTALRLDMIEPFTSVGNLPMTNGKVGLPQTLGNCSQNQTPPRVSEFLWLNADWTEGFGGPALLYQDAWKCLGVI